MKSDDSLNKLQGEIDRRARIVADSLLRNDKVTAKDNMELIDLASALIDKLKKTPSRIKPPLIIGLITVILIGLGLTIRIPKTKISADITTKKASFTLKKEWAIDNRFTSSELTIDNLREVDWAGANINVSNEQPFTFELKGQDIVIDRFALDSSSQLTIQLENDFQNFIIKNDAFITDVQVGKAHIIINDEELDTTLNSEVPEIFRVKAFESRAMPVHITLSDTGNWSIRDILISDINFLEESLPGSGKFNSSITSGSIRILEIEKEERLEEGDWLLLKDLNISRFHISKIGSDLKIHITGDVSKARVGSELFKKTLNPTIIEYLYYAKSFAFFWSCIIFIWSLLWSFKNTLLLK